jgi:hypothetical protein
MQLQWRSSSGKRDIEQSIGCRELAGQDSGDEDRQS